jgi:predicted nucleotidyltransferase
MSVKIDIDEVKISEFCRKWKIKELSFFGSVLRDDFGPESDIDVMVSFDPDEHWNLWDHYHMREELKELFGRPVDLITRRSIERSHNWIRKKAILEGSEAIYVKR